MSSPLVQPPVARAKALSCPNCGGPIELRGFGHALTAVCPQCLSVLDASSPELTVLQQINEKMRVTPLIPLGTRGKLNGAEWELIGFQQRDVDDDGEHFSWDEYLLFNPYKGFRYLTVYEGHWNFVTPLESAPQRIAMGFRLAVSMDGRMFKHFDGANATTSFVLGEFPWRVKVGEGALCDDFIDPPSVLSSETTSDEITWSRGEYTKGSEIWKAFNLPGGPPEAPGVYLNQPSPYAKKGSAWTHFFWFLLVVIALACVFADISKDDVVFEHEYRFSTASTGEASFVTPVFQMKGKTSGVELKITTDLANNWAYFNLALINNDDGQAFDFGREVSYYYGSDSDGAWSEGGKDSSAYIPSVPPGNYYLRVEPEMDAPPGASSSVVSTSTGTRRIPARANTVDYTLRLRHDVPNYNWFWIAVVLLLIPPIVHSVRRRGFESKRWAQSGGGPAGGAGGLAGKAVMGIIESALDS